MTTANEYLAVGFALAVVGVALTTVLVGGSDNKWLLSLGIAVTSLVSGVMLLIGCVAKGVEVGTREGAGRQALNVATTQGVGIRA